MIDLTQFDVWTLAAMLSVNLRFLKYPTKQIEVT